MRKRRNITKKCYVKTKMKNNKILITVFLFIFLQIMVFSTTSRAALESNGNTPVTKDLGTWITSIRKMESAGGTLGLSETIDETKLTSTSGSNSLDIHMEKNGEYGIMAILSASSYGNPNPVGDGETTTGNPTGIKINLNKEWVSAGTVLRCSQYVSADSRYKDIYTASPQVRKAGDAMLETTGWHGSTGDTYFYCSGDFGADAVNGLVRAYSNSIFSFYSSTRNYYGNIGGDTPYTASFHTRAVIVNGPEL